MKFLNKLLVINILVIFISFEAHSAAWLQPEGNVQIISDLELYKYKVNKPIFNFQKKEFKLSQNIEHGILPYLTIGGGWRGEYSKKTFSSRILTNNERFSKKDYSTDQNLYLRHLIYRNDNNVLSAQYKINIPDKDFEIRGLWGRGFIVNKKNNFVNIELAVKRRLTHASEINMDITHGIHLNDKWMTLSQLFITKYYKNPYSKTTTQVLYINRKRIVRTIKNPFYEKFKQIYKISLVRKINSQNSIQFSYSAHSVNNQYNGKSISLGWWLNL
jgi:hypothetical protein